MEVRVEHVRTLRFDDGTPVRAASALARLGEGWLVAQDDATSAAWLVDGRVERLRLLPPVEGHDVFTEADGTKHLKPDLEAACPVRLAGVAGVLLLGSGATPRRRRVVLVSGERTPAVRATDLGPLYDAVAASLSVPDGQLNLEGAALLGDRVRWFQRGNLAAGVPSGSVDVELAALLEAVRGDRAAADVAVTGARHYVLGELAGVGLAVTDAVALPDGRLLVSAAAEDTSNPVDDGVVVGAVLALLDGDRVVEVVAVPEVEGVVQKVEGLGLLEVLDAGVRLLAVVDADDPLAPSVELTLTVSDLPPPAP